MSKATWIKLKIIFLKKLQKYELLNLYESKESENSIKGVLFFQLSSNVTAKQLRKTFQEIAAATIDFGLEGELIFLDCCLITLVNKFSLKFLIRDVSKLFYISFCADSKFFLVFSLENQVFKIFVFK